MSSRSGEITREEILDRAAEKALEKALGERGSKQQGTEKGTSTDQQESEGADGEPSVGEELATFSASIAARRQDPAELERYYRKARAVIAKDRRDRRRRRWLYGGGSSIGLAQLKDLSETIEWLWGLLATLVG